MTVIAAMRTRTATTEGSTITLRSECIINASADEIWSVLTDFRQFHCWNPFLVSVAGSLADGILRVTARLSQLPRVSFAARLHPVAQCSYLGWDARFAAGLFHAAHFFTIEPLAASRCRFVQTERFSGMMAKPVLLMLAGRFQAAYDRMNKALKQEVEQRR